MTYQSELPSRSDSAWVALSAASRGPWKAAAAAGLIVGAADVGLHLLSASFAVATPLWYALTVFFFVGGAGALLRRSRDQAWAARHPLRYALVPGAGAAASVFALRMMLGFSGPVWNALLAGLTVTVLVTLAGYVARAVHR